MSSKVILFVAMVTGTCKESWNSAALIRENDNKPVLHCSHNYFGSITNNIQYEITWQY